MSKASRLLEELSCVNELVDTPAKYKEYKIERANNGMLLAKCDATKKFFHDTTWNGLKDKINRECRGYYE